MAEIPHHILSQLEDLTVDIAKTVFAVKELAATLHSAQTIAEPQYSEESEN